MGVRLGRGAVIVLSAAVLVGCTILTGVGDLETAGLSDNDGGGNSPATNEGGNPTNNNEGDGGVALPPEADKDGSVLPPSDASTVDGCSNTGCFTMPAGFQLVTYGSRGPSCPTGFDQSTETIESPVTIFGACGCGCNTTQQPQCPTNGDIPSTWGPDGNLTCPNGSSTFVNQGCGTDGFQGPFGDGNEHKYSPPAGGPFGGACTASAVKDGTKVSVTSRQICAATQIPSCMGQICPPAAVKQPFQICIASPGDVACPGNFPNRHLTGSTTNFNCSNGCNCPGVNATCNGGKLHFYPTNDCTGAPGLTANVNATCVSTTATGAPTFLSHKYVADPPQGVSCIRGGASNPSAVTLNQPATVCCQ